MRRRAAIAIGLAGGLMLAAGGARAEPGGVSISLQDDVDVWANTEGGLRTGSAAMNKLLVSLEADDLAGVPGLTAYVEVFRADGGPALSGRLAGDLQTASNIEAPAETRLSQAWLEQAFGARASVRIGVIDLNADFDTIEPATLMIQSSHGIGPDLATSGPNGPSIYPAPGLGAELRFDPAPALTLQLAAFEAEPAAAGTFADVRLSGEEGALLIGQAVWRPAVGVEATLGVWTYTAAAPLIEDPARARRPRGLYASLAGPVAPSWTGWIRLGSAEPEVQTVDGYLGAGLVRAHPLPGRPDDSLGIAVAHARIGGPARREGGLPAAETSLEITYRAQVGPWLALQPDLQWIRHPASQADLPDALVVGLRLTFTAASR